MLKAMLEIFIAVIMVINPGFLTLLDIGRLPTDNKIDLSKFKLVWEDEFNGDKLDETKWGPSWWVTERKGGYWHEDMVRVEDGNLIITAQHFLRSLFRSISPS